MTVAATVVETQTDGGLPPISFRIHEVRTGSVDGARADFEQMMTQLVAAVLPGVRSITANPGDWGIDAFVGSLAGSSVAIWQAKYFIDGVDDSQKKQVRESFASAVKAAADNGYTLDSWVLCIPASMDAPTTKWWDGWKSRQSKTKVTIELWDATALIKRLNAADGRAVRAAYYHLGPAPGRPLDVAVVPVVPVPADVDLESALFIRQLREAGHTELDAAKREFFNAELIAREIVDKGVPKEVGLLASADATIHSLWEHRYNAACVASSDELLPDLHSTVMADVRAERTTLMPSVTTNIVHVCGLVHRVVEDRRAGWIRNWRPVAEAHVAVSGLSLITATANTTAGEGSAAHG